jgi:hypothetical protein
VAGIFLFLPLLDRLNFDNLAAQAGYPGSRMVPAAAALVSLLCLKLFTQIFTGNPAVALVVLVAPVLGPLLALQFIIDHWSIARWPVLCQVIGLPVWICGLASHMGP